MKVKFENALVDIWKLRGGVVVDTSVGFGHITYLGAVDKIGEEILVKIGIQSGGQEYYFYSDCMTWLEPH